MSLSFFEIGPRLREVVDKVSSHTDLCADVGKLSEDTPEESVLLAERLVNVAGGGGGHLSLVGHVGVGDFRNGCEVEDDSENTDEAGDTKVDILHGLEGATVSADVLEDDLGSKDGSND